MEFIWNDHQNKTFLTEKELSQPGHHSKVICGHTLKNIQMNCITSFV